MTMFPYQETELRGGTRTDHALLMIEVFWAYNIIFFVLLMLEFVFGKGGSLPENTMTELGCGYMSTSNQQRYAQ